MRNLVKSTIVACAAALLAVSSHAIPMLQLGVWDPVAGAYTGSYDTNSDTTVFTGNNAVIRAILTTSNPADLNLDFYISAAILPPTGAAFGNFGAFTFNGTTINSASTLNFGTPPANPAYPDLAPHGIFSANYAEFSFDFSGAQTQTYNVETGTYPGGLSYYADLPLDMAALNPDYLLHFDLYEPHQKPNGHWALDFAPNSHDAEGGPPVPEPSTVVLIASGLGLFAVSTAVRRRKTSV